MFCCCKDLQKVALEDAMAKANKMMSQETDGFSLDIQKAVMAKANQNQEASYPKLFLGMGPRATLQADNKLTATLQFQCLNSTKESDVTCSGKGHSITGSGQDDQGSFEIVEGKWSPAGYSYWIEKRINHKQKEELAMVMINWSQTDEATVTVFDSKGATNRNMRGGMKLSFEKDPEAPLCPSVRTVTK